MLCGQIITLEQYHPKQWIKLQYLVQRYCMKWSTVESSLLKKCHSLETLHQNINWKLLKLKVLSLTCCIIINRVAEKSSVLPILQKSSKMNWKKRLMVSHKRVIHIYAYSFIFRAIYNNSILISTHCAAWPQKAHGKEKEKSTPSPRWH